MSVPRTTWLLLRSRPSTVSARSSFIRPKTTDATNKPASTPRPKNSASPQWDEVSVGTKVAPTLNQTLFKTQVDQGTSYYSPVPSFSKDRGPNDPIASSIISGAPIDLQSRTVRIYKPTKPATQSGNWNGRQWRMDWDILPRGHRWENPLIGWQSSGDFMQGTHVFFKTKDDAIHFAEKQGYDWFAQESNRRSLRPKAYATNFTHSPKKLKIIRTK